MAEKYCGKGGAEAPRPVDPQFVPSGEPEMLNAEGAGKMEGTSSEPDKALAEFAGLGKGTKSSSIQGSGKATITSTGGPGGGYTKKP